MTDLSKKRIAITGGAGFLGKVLVRRLREGGCEHIFVPHIEEYDLTTREAVERLFHDARPEMIFHLAAEVGGIGANRANPGRYFYANMAMGLHLIEASRIRGIDKFIQVGTICAYPKFTEPPFREENLWKGYPEETNAPYGIAKKALLVMLQAYRQQYDLNGIYLLPVNLYGPGDNFDLQTSHVIPALIRKCVEARRRGDKEIEVWGTGQATREFLYVEDCAEGLILAAERYDGPEPANLGAGFEISIADLAAKIIKLTGFEGTIRWDQSRPDGQPRRSLDTSRARELFGFVAKTDFDTGLRNAIEWYREHAQPVRSG
ncbi:MAG: GDP-L-fucose synthase [Phycisphaerales bacterium]|nr:MAG: GDP-L-fucose synthase [Phycisphaerales bacterium]